MQPQKKQYRVDREDLGEIAAAEKNAVALIKAHLEPQLKTFRDLGYSRLEIACAFIIIGYHALRYDRAQKEAEESFGLLYTLCKKRIDQNCSRANKKKLH